ncbi:MAG: transcription termination/antitermination protein NusA [Parcubacteria group bacterium]|jgi:N utilization substance protein A|nr:transcription termination/antitermination protein NusA [Parcubacteria group bacterium]|tara:strand:+ start:9961 stop:11346 length:1386 start_codon:yes stop_codon:yes gene_type:complete
MDTKSFASAIEQICEEKAISKEKVLETIEMALAAAYKKEYDRKGQNIKIKFDLATGQMKVSQIKLVIDESMLRPEMSEQELEQEKEAIPEDEGNRKVRFNPEKHIMIGEVKQPQGKKKPRRPRGSTRDPDLASGKVGIPTKKASGKYKPGDEIEFPLEVAYDFGRIAAQTAKQVIIQRIREAEREAIYDEYKEKQGEITSGIIQRMEGESVFLDIGKATGILFPEEQIPREQYRIGQRLKAYITEVQKDSRGPTIILSRTHPKMVSQLFALEVPEITAGTVEIKSIAREAGSRSKIAVTTNEERVDPIGSMIGQKGTRVQTVINELAGEKIDIIEWSEDPVKFISASLSPAKVLEVAIDEKKNQAKVTVPEDQLSLAIGIKGQNVRLAAKLTDWKIDIIAQKPEQEKKPRRPRGSTRDPDLASGKVGTPAKKASGKTKKKVREAKKTTKTKAKGKKKIKKA